MATLREQVAELEAELAREQARSEQFQQRLAELGEGYQAVVAERDALAAELAELREQHAAVVAEQAAEAAEQERQEAVAAEPLVRVRWTRDPDAGGVTVGPWRRESLRLARIAGWPLGARPERDFERFAWPGKVEDVPPGVAEVLREAGFVTDAPGALLIDASGREVPTPAGASAAGA